MELLGRTTTAIEEARTMTPRPATISTELGLHLIIPGATTMPVRTALSYDIADPYAVQVRFHTGPTEDGDSVEWTFARQLLTDGVAGPAGEGDVRVWPSDGSTGFGVSLSLSSPSGQALFQVPLRELVDFLTMSYEVVPTGAESNHIDVDGELALLLGAQPETEV